MKTPEEYLEQVRRLIETLRLELSAEEIAEVEHLVSHDEPAEGLRTLAWIIYEEQKSVESDSNAEIWAFASGMISKDDMPPNFTLHQRNC